MDEFNNLFLNVSVELNRSQWMVRILNDYKSGLTQQQIIERLCAAFGDHAPSRNTFFEWFTKFLAARHRHSRRGKRCLDDALRSSRPEEVTTNVVAVVHAIVEEDKRVISGVRENHKVIIGIRPNNSAREARSRQSLRTFNIPIGSTMIRKQLG